jgi:integrase
MKLYSLRDSGIIQMLQDGISPEEVMKQADHSSLEITTIYVKHANPSGSEQIKKKGSKF